jgi:uncharacterized membrane protein YtjA (UPF0391 family)
LASVTSFGGIPALSRTIQQILEFLESNRWVGQPRLLKAAFGQPGGHAFQLRVFTRHTGRQQRGTRAGRENALVQHPGIGFDAGAAKIVFAMRLPEIRELARARSPG